VKMGVLKETIRDFKKALDIIEDLCFQFSIVIDQGSYYELDSRALSALEEAFKFLVKQGRAEGDYSRIKIRKREV